MSSTQQDLARMNPFVEEPRLPWARVDAPSLPLVVARFLPFTLPFLVVSVGLAFAMEVREELAQVLAAITLVGVGALGVPWLAAVAVVSLDRVPDLRSVATVAPRSGSPLALYAMWTGVASMFLPLLVWVVSPRVVVALDEDVSPREAGARVWADHGLRAVTILASAAVFVVFSGVAAVASMNSRSESYTFAWLPTLGLLLTYPLSAWMWRRPLPPTR